MLKVIFKSDILPPFIAIALFITILCTPHTVLAQTGDVGWSYPIALSAENGLVSEPTLVSDSSGRLHLFWVGCDGQDRCDPQLNPPSLYYRQWDGASWSLPVDILAPEIAVPAQSVASDLAGKLHIVWMGAGGNFYYSSAYIAQAKTAQGWAAPRLMEEGSSHSNIIADKLGQLYIGVPRKLAPTLIASHDGGNKWLPAVTIAETNPNSGADYIQLAVDQAGHLHAVWTEFTLPEYYPPTGVYYARSDDGGKTWSTPFEIDGELYTQISIITVGQNIIHVVWSGAAAAQGRYHRWSMDGGQTWSDKIILVSPSVKGGTLGLPGLAVDSAGDLHAVVALEEAILHTVWDGAHWQGLEDVSQNTLTTNRHCSLSQPQLAITGGNQLHIIYNDQCSRIMYSTYHIAAPHAPSSPLPPLPTPTQVATANWQSLSSEATPPKFKTEPIPNTETHSSSPSFALLVSSISTTIVLGMTIVFWFTRRGKYRS